MLTRQMRWALAALAATAAMGAAQAQVRKGYIVQLADPPAATYEGGISGLAPTRPAPGTKLDTRAAHVQSYLAYLDTKVGNALNRVPLAKVYYRYGVVLNGFAAQLTDDEVAALAADPGVFAITEDSVRQMDTVTTPAFLGISGPGGIWSQTDAQGRAIKGEDIIIAHVDGGVWPENRSFADHVDAQGRPAFAGTPGATSAYNPLPAGRYLGTCQPGMGFTAANCNNKLIGAQYFNAGWKAGNNPTWQFEYLDSPRDPDGHGTHTLSTAGGNQNAMTPQGVLISGVAPRARVAAYRVCYTGPNGPDATTGNGCVTSDSVAAINKAVADRVDVINFSISGSQTNPRDAVGEAFKNAAAAGIFVSASAGNNGPANAVAHLGTWLTTVGNSTHDRFFIASATLGASSFTGAARFQGSGSLSAPLVLASEAGLPGADPTLVNLCYAAIDNAGTPVLDPAKVAGRIVVCDRGVTARVNKSLAVAQAGGVGMIMLNTSPNSLNNDEHSVPTIHMQSDSRAAVRAIAAGGAQTALFSPSRQDPNVIAPVMSGSSSRGPNRGDPNVLKPDITAPGTDIFAAYGGRANANTADRNAILAGAPGAESAASISGTSMAAPHVAGVAALLKQANPTWSPYAIKSALMTSAAQTVKLASGASDGDRWGFGSGHLDPNAALATKLVYDSTPADHQAYFLRTKPGADVNLASITRSDIIVSGSVARTVTNRGTSPVTYTASALVPGFTVSVSPSSFTLAPGASQTFRVTMAIASALPEVWSFGELVWTGSDGSRTRSPISAKAVGVVVASEISDNRAAASKSYTVGLGFTGRLVTTGTGLVSAVRIASSANTAPTSLFCFTNQRFSVPAGSKLLRVQMFNSETAGGAATDFDLYVQRNSAADGSGTWSTVTNGISALDGSDELVQLRYPTAGVYRLCFVPFSTGGSAKTFVINRWLVGPTVTPTTMRALGASNLTAGGVAAVGVSWQSDPAVRSVGMVEYTAGAGQPLLGNTVVFIDPVSPPAGSPNGGGAVVYRDKKPFQD